MKKIFTILGLVTMSAIFAQTTLPHTDTFTYPDGNLVGNGGWTYIGTPNTTAPDEITVNSGLVSFQGLGNDLQKTITTTNSGTIYYALDLNVTDLTGATEANGGYIAGFAQNSTNFGGTLWIKQVTPTTYKLGVEVRTATGAATTWSTNDFTINQTNRIVVSYSFNSATTTDDTAVLYVNNNVEATDTHTGTDLTSAVSFFLRQDSATETPAVQIDNLTITATATEVLGIAEIIATKSQYLKNTQVENELFFQTKGNAAVKVFNANGQLVKSANISSSNAVVNVSGLPKGMYIVTTETADEKVSQKFMKK